ncbi:beta-N-acetylhexosaminidase [Jatrophihabitans sp. GAS493]|uniref:glycoside hydrolase family 3 protein n=1 Tax=Jatrophihabitans sp. GAS493 TaxID=1907575 RepID=UPI000BBFDA96|nr:glycoside hydrolase family 3 N-terminal domain-containing protein [Jatrophihabitans sp. GAS493]SOD71701.1 beta-N-acetylhexosaminidase [Jatrophihabitans sp. GAS493]
MSIDPQLRRLALSSLMLGFVGPTPPEWLLAALADGLGGVVLFGSNLGDGREVRRLTDSMRAAAGHEILISLDEEGGEVTRLDTQRGSASPGAAALGQLDDPAMTEAVYAEIGWRLVEAGIDMNLAPVADVNTDPLNPVIGLRSFSCDPQVAARHVAAAVRGLQGAGVAACVKHFPGHGATRADSHHGVAVLDRSRAQIEAVELEPFRAAIAAGAMSIMTGHLVVPALDGLVATVSPAITTGLLRGELGFAGTIFTDALEMKAISQTIGMVEGFVQALIAGADSIETGALDYPELLSEIPAAVQRAVTEGRLSEQRLRDAAERTQRLTGSRRRGAPAVLTLAERALLAPAAASASERSIEIMGELPVLERPLVVECATPAGMASGALPWSLAEPLAELLPGSEVLRVSSAPDVPAILSRSQGRGLVVLVRDPARAEWQRPLIEATQRHPAAVIVDAGWPEQLAVSTPVIRTRGVAPGLMAAAAAALAAPYASTTQIQETSV